MQFRFLLPDTQIEIADRLPEVDPIAYSDSFTELNETQFHLHVPGTADFYVKDGNSIQIQLHNNFDHQKVELFLNGSVLGALILQRGGFPLHASSFTFNKKSAIICGESGAGKSSLTFSMVMDHSAGFISDDITPIRSNDRLVVDPLADRMKLWANELNQRDIDLSTLERVKGDRDKYFYTLQHVEKEHEIGSILFLSISEDNRLHFRELQGSEKFELLTKNIFRKEYLSGMKSAQIALFSVLSQLCEQTPFYSVQRPSQMNSSDFALHVKDFLSKNESH